MITTYNFEDSKSIDDIKYIDNLINSGEDDYPIDKYFEKIKDNRIYKKWQEVNKELQLKLGYKSECDNGYAIINADINLLIKRAKESDVKIDIKITKLMKFFSVIQIKNKCSYEFLQDYLLIQALIKKEINPSEYATEVLKIDFQSLLFAVYFTLVYIVEKNKYLIDLFQFFMNELYPLILEEVKSISIRQALKNLENVITNKETFTKTLEMYIKKKDKLFQNLIKNAEEIY